MDFLFPGFFFFFLIFSLSAVDDFIFSFRALMCGAMLSSFDASGKMQRDLFGPLWD